MKRHGYYYLEKGDIIKPGDEFDNINDGWRDMPNWTTYTGPRIGHPAPDPQYISHTQFRRKIKNDADELREGEG